MRGKLFLQISFAMWCKKKVIIWVFTMQNKHTSPKQGNANVLAHILAVFKHFSPI